MPSDAFYLSRPVLTQHVGRCGLGTGLRIVATRRRWEGGNLVSGGGPRATSITCTFGGAAACRLAVESGVIWTLPTISGFRMDSGSLLPLSADSISTLPSCLNPANLMMGCGWPTVLAQLNCASPLCKVCKEGIWMGCLQFWSWRAGPTPIFCLDTRPAIILYCVLNMPFDYKTPRKELCSCIIIPMCIAAADLGCTNSLHPPRLLPTLHPVDCSVFCPRGGESSLAWRLLVGRRAVL